MPGRVYNCSMKKTLIVILAVLAIIALLGYLGYRTIMQRAAGENLPLLESAGAAFAPGTYRNSLETSDGRTRTYVIHIPAGYDASKAYPLVLLFHGGGPAGSGALIMRGTRFDKEASAEGFIVVAPDGVEQSWHDARETTFAAEEGVDDVEFVRELTEHLAATLPIDEKRIYATGASNGGFMSHRLGCELPGVFAAIAPVIASMPLQGVQSCDPSPTSFLGIQGTADPGIPIQGGAMGENDTEFSRAVKRSGRGQGGVVLSAEETMALWASKNGCGLTPSVTHVPPTVDDGTSVDHYVFPACPAGIGVEYYIVNGMGHTWPPNTGIRPSLSGNSTKNLDATDVIWEFFAAHPKP